MNIVDIVDFSSKMGQVLKAYYDGLIHEGLSEELAMRLTVGYQGHLLISFERDGADNE